MFGFTNDTKKPHRCIGCEYNKRVFANSQWEFRGCYHKPYRGKWIAEIKDCPKEGEADGKIT